MLRSSFSPFHSGYRLTCTVTDSERSGWNAVRSALFIKAKTTFRNRIVSFYGLTRNPLKYIMDISIFASVYTRVAFAFVVSSVSFSLSHWYPGSGVVLDCIDSWSLHHYLLWTPMKYCEYCTLRQLILYGIAHCLSLTKIAIWLLNTGITAFINTSKEFLSHFRLSTFQ